MKVDRRYILLGRFNRTGTSGDGSDFYSIDLREILNDLYDNYTRFNIKLESYHSRTAATVGLPSDVQFLHLSGLNWLNGYDTNPNFPSSRVAAVMFFNNDQVEFARSMLYPSNIATLMFQDKHHQE